MSLNSNEETAVCLLAANSTCYYGMPSISADDPAFLVAGGTSGELPDSFIGSSEHNLIVLSAMMCHQRAGIYWRGETWAPQAYLTYLALGKYAQKLPALASAKAGLAKQQLALMLSVWRAQHSTSLHPPPCLPPQPSCYPIGQSRTGCLPRVQHSPWKLTRVRCCCTLALAHNLGIILCQTSARTTRRHTGRGSRRRGRRRQASRRGRGGATHALATISTAGEGSRPSWR